MVNKYKVNYNKLNEEFDKAHGIGKMGEQPLIVRFKSHGFRANIYIHILLKADLHQK